MLFRGKTMSPADRSSVVEVARTAAGFAERHIRPTAAEADHSDPRFPEEVFARGIEAGFDRIALPEDIGGLGFHVPELCALVETLARTCAGHAMVFGVHAAAMRALADSNGEEAGNVLDEVLPAQRPIAVCLPEPVSAEDFDAGLTALDGGAGDPRLSGSGGLAVNVGNPGFLLTFTRTSDNIPVCLLIGDGSGSLPVSTPEAVLGLRAMPMAELNLTDQSGFAWRVIARERRALALYRSLMGDLCLATAAAASGLAQSACDRALSYAAERYQGGRTIIDHSHLREILGGMYADTAASRGAVSAAASLTADDPARIGTKMSVTEHAARTCTDAVQILGGYGYMRDYGLEKAMRDAAVLALLPISNARAGLWIAAIQKEALP